MKAVAVFCGGSAGVNPAYTQAAEELGRELAGRGLTLVYGGGHIGLMGVLADAALAAGGKVAGVIPQSLVDREIAHTKLSRLEVVPDMLTRKARMAELADAFIALPGGYGTLDELFEMLTWTRIGVQIKPCGVLNVEGYYDKLISWIAHADNQGFIRAGHRDLLVAEAEITKLLDKLASWTFQDVSLK